MTDLLHETEEAVKKFEICTDKDHVDNKLPALLEAQRLIMDLLMKDSKNGWSLYDRCNAHAKKIGCKVITMRAAS